MTEVEAINPQPNDRAMRIFLSYGHDANDELVLRIKADLEKRGHNVWFDKSEIRFGDDWRREITDGILKSNRVLSFLSKYSTRDPGVCLDELAIAIGAKGGSIQTILVESEAEVTPPPSIGHIQWLDMHDWKERRAADKEAWEIWYGKQLDEILRVIESDESRRFAGEIRLLEELLKPISSDSRMAELLKKPLVGRTWLFEALDKWRDTDLTSRLFWIVGAPGVGKSAFAAHLAHYGRDKVIAVQFCEYDKPDHRDVRRIVRTLAFQIATRLPDYRKLLLTLPEIKDLDGKNPSELFDYLIANPLKLSISGGRERYLVMIDALDEAAEGGRNPLVEMLALNASRLPDWISLVITSRPESNVIGPLQGLNPFVLDTESDKNRDDIREYLLRQLREPLKNRLNAGSLVEQILEKSEGVFLYVERFCDDVLQNHLSFDDPTRFPQGLGGIFYQYFQRQFPDEEKYEKVDEPALGAILAAREPLPVEILQNLLCWSEAQIRKWLLRVGSLFLVVTENGVEVVKPYHKSITDWLTDKSRPGAYFVSSAQGHQNLSNLGWTEFKDANSDMHAYFLNWLYYHFVELKDDDRLITIVSSQLFWKNSRAFQQGRFYHDVARCLGITRAITILNPAFEYFAERAVSISPEKLGFTLFPHEPGVHFDNGTRVYGEHWPYQEYTIPKGAKDPPSEVLWEFIKASNSAFNSSSAFLEGSPYLPVIVWYRSYWKKYALQAILNAIERYYDSCPVSLAHRAMELSLNIDEVANQLIIKKRSDDNAL